MCPSHEYLSHPSLPDRFSNLTCPRQLKAVLTPEQFAKLQARRAEHRNEKAKEHDGKMKMKH